MSVLNRERAAMVLVEAVFFGDQSAADRYSLTKRTVRGYRERLSTDKELSSLFQIKKDAFESGWAEEIPAAMRQGTRFIIRAAQEGDASDPDMVHSIAGAMKILAEIGLTKEILDVRYGGLNRANPQENRQMVASGSESADLSE